MEPLSPDGARAPPAARRLDPPWAQRGTDTGRLLALSDGIFAFAMTLLVLGLALPVGFRPSDLWGDLVNLQSAFLAYVLSFFVIWFYWVAHHQVFSYIVSFDRPLQQLNVLFLLGIAVMPFVTDVLSAGNSTTLAVLVYAVAQLYAGGLLTLLWLYASRKGGHVTPELPREWVDYVLYRTAASPVVFAISIPVAFVNPRAAEFVWFGLFVIQIAVRRKRLGSSETPPESAPAPASR